MNMLLRKMSILLFFLSLVTMLNSQVRIASGPMIGYVEMTEACIWAQTSGPGNVCVSYHEKGKPAQPKTVCAATTSGEAYTAHLVLSQLEPGTTYECSVSTDEKNRSAQVFDISTQALWQFRFDPPSFRVALGSCTYINEEKYDRPGEPYGGDYYIFDTIVSKDPDLMLWLGDNIYLREVDYSSRSGVLHRYTHTRAIPELRKLLSHCPNYAIWDDHDFGPNDSNGSFIHKDWTSDAFKMFWANPSYGIPATTHANDAITTQFAWGDIDFFLLDNRSARIAADVIANEKPTILGAEQIAWLIQSLKFSRAPFKVIAMGGQFLNSVDKFETYATCPEERALILSLIEQNNITGVVFLTGDRHCGELSELKLSNGIVVYDLTASPLTSHAYDLSKEENTLRVPGTLVPERNFATLDFSGKRGERKMKMTCYDSRGNTKWEKVIEQPR